MKKPYQKPQLLVECFELTSVIASCGTTQIHFVDQGCILSSPDATDQMKDLANFGFFAGGTCTSLPPDDVAYCYHTNVNMVFTS